MLTLLANITSLTLTLKSVIYKITLEFFRFPDLLVLHSNVNFLTISFIINLLKNLLRY